MRYIETGIQDKESKYFFDSSNFDIYSYFIYFDSTMQQVDLVGVMDETDVTVPYISQNYFSQYAYNIAPLSTLMFNHLYSFNYISDFTMDSTYDITNTDLNKEILQFIDKINQYNQTVSKHIYYNHDINNIYPFAEFLVIKLKGTDIIVKASLSKFITKSVGTGVVYTLNNEEMMNKYITHYSTYQSDFTSIYMKSLYNYQDQETINKEDIVISTVLLPTVKNDSSKLYFDVVLDSTTSNVAYKYQFFDLTATQLIYINNKYLSRVKSISDSTQYNAPDYTIRSTYSIELLEFDNTTELLDYMGGSTVYEYYDFTRETYKYLFNIRIIKKLDFKNEFYTNSNSYIKLLLSLKTFYGYQNRPTNEAVSNQNTIFTTVSDLSPIVYSGLYDITNNSTFNFLSLLSSFTTDTYPLPYDATILKSSIENGTPFSIDIFISNSSDVTKFLGNFIRNGVYIFNEGNIQDVMLLKCERLVTVASNTYRLYLSTVIYDETQLAGLGSVYHIPSNSHLIQYKYHIFNVIPYIKISDFNFNNDINNIMNIYSFSYVAADPTSLNWNGYEFTV